MTAATAPSPSPAPSAPPLAHTPSRQSSVEPSSRRHDASTSVPPAKVTSPSSSSSMSTSVTAPSNHAAGSLGTLAKPIDLASPPASPTLVASTAPDRSVSNPTRLAHASSPAPSTPVTASIGADAAGPSSALLPRRDPPYANALATPNRLLPPTPLGNAGDRAAATSPSRSASSTPSRTVQLPAPYKAPRLAQSGASESFATAYPTQETRQKYASPSKPLPPASGAALSHKRSWQSSGSVDLSNKKFRPTNVAALSPSTSLAKPPATPTTPAPTASMASPLPTARAGPSSAPARPSASTPTIPRPSTVAPATGRAANVSSGITITNIPTPGSSLSNQAGIGPLNLLPAISGTQLPASVRDEYLSLLQKSELIDLVKHLERQLNDLVAAPTGASTLYRQARIYPNQIHSQIDRLRARQRVEASRSASHSDLSLKDVYSLLNAGASTPSATKYARTPAHAIRPSAKSAPLTPAKAASLASAAAPPATKTRAAHGPAPTISPAALRSIVGDGPMPSNAALAAAIAAHFGGSLPGKAARPASSTSAAPPGSATRMATNTASAPSGSSQALTAARRPSIAAPTPAPGNDISDKIAAILNSSSSSQTTMLGPQGLPLAPAAPAPDSGPGSGSLPIGNIAAMLSSFAGQTPVSRVSAGSANSGVRTTTSAAEGRDSALSNLLQHLEEAKRRMPSQTATSSTTASVAATSPASSSSTTVYDPIAILTGASANPVFQTTYPSGPSASTPPVMTHGREVSWSPEPEPVIVQGPLGTSTLPSYEDMIVEGLRVMGEAPPRNLFNWMQDTYPLTKKFRPSAHQALQKAFKRGRLLKTGSMYRINPSWSDPGESRKPTRRPQVGRDHPMVTPGLNGEVLAVSPHKDSQAYRNVGDSGIRSAGKGMRSGPRPYGQPGAAPLANPASSIFQNGSAASIILEYQKRTGKKLDADSVKQLYQLIRSGPSDGSAEEMLAHLLTQTGYHDAAATATAAAAAQSAAAAMSASIPPYARPGTSLPGMASGSLVPSTMRTGAATAGAAGQRRMAPAPVAKGPTSLPLPTTSEPTMMQQLASMLNDLSSPINPVLANSLLGQLSSNAAAAAAARAANMANLSTGPPQPAMPARKSAPAPSAPMSVPSQLASALSSLSGHAPQQDLDSAVSETLAAALQQIGAAPATVPSTSEDAPTETVSEEVPSTAKAGDANVSVGAEAGEADDAEGVDLAEYQDAIRALTSAFVNTGDTAEDGDTEDSDVEADERAIAAAEAEPDSVEETASQAENAAQESDQAESIQHTQPRNLGQEDQHRDDANEGEDGEEEEEEEEEDDEDADAEEQMDLSAVLRQLTASLQARQQDNEPDAEKKDDHNGKSQVDESAPATQDHQEAEKPASTERGGIDDPKANKSASGDVDSVDVDQSTEEARDTETQGDQADQTETGQETSEKSAHEEGGSEDAASLQAQLEALVASLAANAGNANDDDDDDDDNDEEEQDEEEEEDGDEDGHRRGG